MFRNFADEYGSFRNNTKLLRSVGSICCKEILQTGENAPSTHLRNLSKLPNFKTVN